jgi:hypothetical protein
MGKYLRKPPFWVGASLVGLGGMLLCLVAPSLPAGAQDYRTWQVWPDRSLGVSSGLLEGATVRDAAQVFPFGVCRTSGDVVYARTYLHFPLDVFPPGSEVLHATLHVYVDSSSDTGEARLGAYRVLEPWGEGNRTEDAAAWPALLTSPIAVTAARFDVTTSVLPVPKAVAAAISNRAATFLTSPLLTPTPTETPRPTATPDLTAIPTRELTPSPPVSPLPTPTPSSPGAGPSVPLGQVAGGWLTWDVTALLRAWMAGEVPDDGLALAAGPEPNADPETAGGLLVARQFTADDPGTRPYLIVEFEVRPVTPTPVPVLPSAGSPMGWTAAGLLLIGVVLLILGPLVQRKF